MRCALTRGRGAAQVAVAVVRRAGGSGGAASRAERLAKGLHDAWGVGDACGSGVVLLLAVEDRQARPARGDARRAAVGTARASQP